MSSHHIVRDNQEPALLLLDGEISFDEVQDFLEWSPFIVVDEKNAKAAVNWGIKFDGVICSSDRARFIEEDLADQLPFKKLIYKENEDPLEPSLQFLEDAGHSFVTIFSNQVEIFRKIEQRETTTAVIVIQNSMRWALVRSGHYQKWVDDDEIICLKQNGVDEILRPIKNRILAESKNAFWIGEKLVPADD